MKLEFCQYCKQGTAFVSCSCRSYKVWAAENSESKAKTIDSRDHRLAAEYFAYLTRRDAEDGDCLEVCVRQGNGPIKYFRLYAEVTDIEWNAEELQYTEEESA
jgi:hypothetical protein